MFNPPVQSPEPMESFYGPKPKERAINILDDIVSVEVSDLFPDINERIYKYGGDLSAITKSTGEALSRIDMSMIKPGDTVKILSSEHGYSIMGGDVYAAMLEAVKDNVKTATGCKDVRLMVGAYKGFRESDEFIRRYELDKRFEGKVYGYGPYDRDVAIDTEIGTIYAIKKIFDGDWFIHCYYDDPREIYYHRQIQRAFKPFGMSYVRFETRSCYHMNFANRSCNYLPIAVFYSPYIQQRYAFSCVLRHSPIGILKVDADRDLAALDRRIAISHLRKYGKMMRLFHEIDEAIAVADGGRWGFYLHAGGTIFGVFMHAHDDLFDITNAKVLGGFKKNAKGEVVPMTINPACKVIVLHQAWPGINYLGLEETPMVIAGEDHAAMWQADHCNPYISETARVAPDLPKAMEIAQDFYRTDKVIIFDGSFGNINCSRSLAEFLVKKAPEVNREVEEKLLPMWLKQRGINPHELDSHS
ncbi:MAG: hypothetical protein ABSF52_15475 [Syntrophobacteraceae bacterium]|jgi:hypothetical protein